MVSFDVKKLKEYNLELDIPAYGLSEDGNAIGYIYDEIWDYCGHADVGLGKKTEISFSHIEDAYRASIQEVLYKIILRKGNFSVSSLCGTRNNLLKIKQFLNTSDWSILNDDDTYRSFRSYIKNQNLAKGTVETIAGTLKELFILKLTNRNIGVQKKFIKDLSKPEGHKRQNVALPEDMMFDIYNAAIDYVEKYYSERNKINAENKKYRELFEEYKQSEYGGEFNKWLKKCNIKIDFNLILDVSYQERLGLFTKRKARKTLISSIQTACLIVLGGFSGARIGEITSFNSNNYQKVNINGMEVPLLIGFNTKNQKGGKKKREVYPTHEVSKKALTLAHDITQFARDKYISEINNMDIPTEQKNKLINEAKSTFITIETNSKEKSFLLSHQDRAMQRFAKILCKPATRKDVEEYNLLNPYRKGDLIEGQHLPSFSPHTLRRTFAVFVKRNKLADILTIRYATKHKNLAMTAMYANHSELASLQDFEMDSELVDLIVEVNDELFADELFYIFNEAETLSGGEGKRILAERERYQGTIYMSRDSILNKIKGKTISLVELATGYCIKSDCSQTCFTHDCKTKIVTYEKAMYQKEARERIIRRFNRYNKGLPYSNAILEKMLCEIGSIEKTLIEHKIEFSPFDGAILRPDNCKAGVTNE